MRLHLPVGISLLLPTAFALAAPALARAVKQAVWGCSCRTYDGGTENFYSFAEISGRMFQLGAFENSGEGRYRVKRRNGGFVLTSTIRTGDAQRLFVCIVEPRRGPANLYLGTDNNRNPKNPLFTAGCSGTIPNHR
jgi:hypothetical protein